MRAINPDNSSGRAVAPVRGELKLMLMVDDLGQRLRVRLVADMPSGDGNSAQSRITFTNFY